MNSVPVGQIVEENGQVRIVVERTKKIVKFEIRTANNFQNSNGKESEETKTSQEEHSNQSSSSGEKTTITTVDQDNSLDFHFDDLPEEMQNMLYDEIDEVYQNMSCESEATEPLKEKTWFATLLLCPWPTFV